MNPTLVEPGVKYFIKETLKTCSQHKQTYYNYVFNVIMFVCFVLAIGLFLYVKYTNNNNIEKKRLQKQQEEEYMLNLVHTIQTEKRIHDGSKITDLPEITNDNGIDHTKYFL